MRAPLKMEDADMLGSMLRETGGVVARGHNTPKAAVVERKLRFPRILHIFYTRGRARVDIRVFVFFEAPPLFTLFQTPTPLTNTLPTPEILSQAHVLRRNDSEPYACDRVANVDAGSDCLMK